MAAKLLTKGLEIEHYLGKSSGLLLPLSREVLEFAQKEDGSQAHFESS